MTLSSLLAAVDDDGRICRLLSLSLVGTLGPGTDGPRASSRERGREWLIKRLAAAAGRRGAGADRVPTSVESTVKDLSRATLAPRFLYFKDWLGKEDRGPRSSVTPSPAASVYIYTTLGYTAYGRVHYCGMKI